MNKKFTAVLEKSSEAKGAHTSHLHLRPRAGGRGAGGRFRSRRRRFPIERHRSR